MYPARPSFVSNTTPASLWWRYTRPTGVDVCSISPDAWMRLVRTSLGLDTSRLAWDDALGNALVNAASNFAREQPGVGWDGIVAEMQRSLSARQPTAEAVAFATWFAIYRPHNLRYDAISFNGNLELPGWGATMPTYTGPRRSREGDALVCFRPDIEPALARSDAELRDLERLSAKGVRERAGEPLGQVGGVLNVAPEAVSPLWLALGALALIGVSFAAYRSTSENTSARRRRR